MGAGEWWAEEESDCAPPWSAREAIAFLRTARAHRLYAACVLAELLEDPLIG
ncbi:hypothetical protein ACFV8Z_26415 [Streptomyces sp. NPDC059837]|uniref:hypothetical protein n=1 Tax=unclassified Streptomyces TaxID=2593676 RepID=UPI00225BBADF|nr:hypothetical protein [Streptomyces sp. NBC_00365]MCX5089985.1 hypothetical protein [Streptomyces sp. NBC_00365]